MLLSKILAVLLVEEVHLSQHMIFTKLAILKMLLLPYFSIYLSKIFKAALFLDFAVNYVSNF